MRLPTALSCLIVAFASPAFASDATRFASAVGVAPDAVDGVAAHRVRGGDFTQMISGRYRSTPSAAWFGGLALIGCDAHDQCTSRRVEFGAVDDVVVLGIVDLAGKPAALPRGAAAELSARGTFPVVAVRTSKRSDKSRTSHLYLISLVADDRGSVVLQDTASRHHDGRGFDRSYRFERAKLDDKPNKPGAKQPNDAILELVVTEQKIITGRCKRPDPVELRFRITDRHFRQAEGELGPSTPCR